jgi:8-oxo-dGTP diphosphatase
MVVKIRLTKAIIKHRDRYLFLRKAEDKYFSENIGKWECSGGTIKEGETSIDAILREVGRETGLEVKVNKELPKLRMTDENYDSECDVYLLESKSEDIKLSSEHSDYIWVYANEVRNMNLVLYASLLLEFFNNSERYLE